MASESESEKRETLADIVAEMRKTIPGGPEMWWRNSWAKDYADRIEAAWKCDAAIHAMTCEANERLREHLEIALEDNERPVGNAAAMRDALREAIGETCSGCSRDCDDCINLKSGWMKKAKAALSAPARNCDKFVTQSEMSRAYEEYRKSAMKNYGNGLTGRVPTVKQKPMTYDEWLLAPAAERKGDGDE